ncbi:MAG: hypothetical protein AAF360_08015, partial [Pseudomonadota bacterium]
MTPTATALVASVTAGERRAAAIAEDSIADARTRDPAINAFTDWTTDRMRRDAAAVDVDPAAAGPL